MPNGSLNLFGSPIFWGHADIPMYPYELVSEMLGCRIIELGLKTFNDLSPAVGHMAKKNGDPETCT
jgi:hypothetical protein